MNRDGRGRFVAGESDDDEAVPYAVPGKADAALIKTARSRWTHAESAESEQRQREQDDLRFYAGDQWPEDIKKSRKGQLASGGMPDVPARPTLTINKTREPVRQVLNAERQSDMGIEIVPSDDFGGDGTPIDHTEITLREGLVRRIQRDSEASDARTWAFSRATIAGRGYYGVMTRYLPGKTADQEVYIHRFFNQSAVLLDPAHEQPDGSDAEFGFVGVDLPYDEYKAQFPTVNGKPNRVCTSDDEWRAVGDEAPSWFSTSGDEDARRSVRVVDYYYTVHESRDLAMFKDGRVAWVDELAKEVTGFEVRAVDQKSIKWAKIDGCQVLDETDWPGHYLPIVKVLGEELQPYDRERRCEGMVRNAIDACRSFNYMVSKWVEQIGLAPIPPWVMAAGQDEGFEAEWLASNTRTLPALHYNQKDINNEPAPPPQRTNVTTDIAAIAGSVQLFNEAITSTMGVPESALGHVDPSVKSGTLAKALIEQSQRGTSNYLDNLKRSMRHEGRIVNDLLYPIYGRAGRLVRLTNQEGKSESVLLGQPFVKQGEGPSARPVPAPPGAPNPTTMQLTADADWNVAVKVSKNYDTRREQEAATLGEIIAADPTQMAIIGDLFFQNQDGPGHEQMAERYKVMLAPPVQALVSGKGAIPPEIQQQMQQATEQMQQLQAELAKAQEIIKGKQIETTAQFRKAQLDTSADLEKTRMELDSKEKIALMQATASMTTAQSKIDAEDARTFVDAMESRLGHALSLHLEKLGHLRDHVAQIREHTHEKDLAVMGHAHALEAGQQAADLAPEPTAGADA